MWRLAELPFSAENACLKLARGEAPARSWGVLHPRRITLWDSPRRSARASGQGTALFVKAVAIDSALAAAVVVVVADAIIRDLRSSSTAAR